VNSISCDLPLFRTMHWVFHFHLIALTNVLGCALRTSSKPARMLTLALRRAFRASA
jgi:hypothetical protein